MSSNTPNSIMINTEKDLKISNSFNRFVGQVDSRTRQKNIPSVWNVGQFDIGQLEREISLVQHFGSSKFSDK